MSDPEVRAALERMEAWLTESLADLDAEALAVLDQGLRAAIAGAERGADWPELVARAHALGERMAIRTEVLQAKQAELRRELNAQVKGGRALKGYGSVAR